MSFIKLLADHVRDEGLLQRDDRVVVGVSGGPDSMALLHGLVGLNSSADFQLALHIVHLNHQLRGEAAEQDATFVQAAADDLELPCTIERRDIRALTGPSGAVEHTAMEDASWLGYAGRPSSSGAIEETARRERYALFERAALATDSSVICVGHQADDNAETILHRIVRGTGLRGMAGIPARRRLRAGSDIWLVRPLLRFPRRKLLEFLADAGIPYREDESNAYPAAADVLSASRTPADFSLGRPAPMRNFIRNVVLPLLETQINPHVREALLRLAEQARWVDEHLAETVFRNFETLVVSRSERELVLSARALARRSRIIQAEVLRHAIISLHVGEQDLSFTHLSSVCDLLAGRASGKQIKLPGGLTATKRYDRLILSLPGEPSLEAIPDEIAVHVPGRTILPVRRLELICALEEGRPPPRAADSSVPHEPRNRFEESIDFEQVQLPLVVRKRRRGERFWPLGAPGTKKVSDFLMDAKVDPIERERIAVLCDQQGPIWIIGHRIDERVKLTDATRRTLHVRVAPL